MRQMNYQKASPNSGRGISASQWNGFLDMHRDYYGGNASNGPLPPILSQSVIANAVLQEDMDAIGPYQPVRIVKTINFVNVLDGLPSYVVEPVDATDENGDPTERHGNYGFTLGEGCTPGGGGRIVVSGIALVAIEAQYVAYDKIQQLRDGMYETLFYAVPDGTLSNDYSLSAASLAPVGHFKLVGSFDTTQIEGFDSDDLLYLAVDMEQRSTRFVAELDSIILGATQTTDKLTMSSGTAFVYYGVKESTASAGETEIIMDEFGYEIEVYNPFGFTSSVGNQLIEYSTEYNRFVLAQPQTVKIGKADADISVGSTGTISIWRDGSDTTENEDAKLDWMAGTTQVSSGKEVMITWFADEGIWRITGAECES